MPDSLPFGWSIEEGTGRLIDEQGRIIENLQRAQPNPYLEVAEIANLDPVEELPYQPYDYERA